MLRSFGTKAYLALALGLLFGILSVVVVVLVNMTMKRQALSDAEEAARMLLDHNLAVHTYFTKDLKPKLFEQLGPTTSKDYFEPVWMSSTYAVRKMDGYFRQFNQSPYYYKESAINARSPENEADDYEKAFLEDLQSNPELTTKSAIRVLDGKPYFTFLRRGETMEESCLRCHSTPEQAPGDMVRHYGPQRSFHRKVQDVAQAISIRIPLSEAFSSATSFSFHLSGLLLLALGVGFLFVWVGNKRLLIRPMAEIREHAVKIASEPERLGETIPEPKVRELRDLVIAFNQMSVELRRTYDEQEQRIMERTNDLAAANRQLEKEVESRLKAAEELRVSEAQYRAVFDNASVGIDLFDRNGRTVKVNRALTNMLGYTEEEFIRLHFLDITHPDDRDISKRRLEALMAGEIDSYRLEKRYVKKDGGIVWVDLWTGTIRDAHGDRSGTVGVIADITERKRAEEALRQSEELYRSLFKNMLNGFAYCQMHFDDRNRPWDFTYLAVNEAFETLTGLRDVAGKSVSEVIPGIREADPELLEVYGRVARSGRPERFEMFVESLQLWFWISVYSSEPGYFTAFFDVITDRKKAEEALRESEEKFRSLFESSLDGILLTAPDGQVFNANQAACQIFGCTEQELCEAGRDGVVDQTDPRLSLALEERRRTGQYKGELNFKRKDGTVFPAEISSAIFSAAKGDLRANIIIRNITERKKFEEELEKSRAELEAIYEYAPVMMCVLDGERHVLYANRAFVDFVGKSDSELREGRACGVFGCINALDDPRGCGYGPNCGSCALRSAIEDTYKSGIGNRAIEYRSTLIGNGRQREVVLLGSTARIHARDRSSVLLCLEDVTARERAGKALRESEERFRKVFEQGPLGMAILSLDYRWVSVNARLCEMLGYSEDELLRLTFVDLTHPDDIEADLEQSSRLLSGEIPVRRTTKRYIRKNGETLWISLTATLVRDEQGEPIYFLSMVEDISERKRVEEALRESEERYRIFFETSRESVFMTPVDGRFVEVNDVALEVFGYSSGEKQEMLQREVASFYANPGERDAVVAKVAAIGFVKDYPVDLRKRDGTIFHALVTAVARKDPHGIVIGFQGTIRDITQQKRAEELLRTTLQRFYTILSSLYAGVLIVTEEGRVEFVNQAFCNLFDLDDPPASLYGLTAPEIIARIRDVYAQPARAEARIREILHKGQPVKGQQIAMRGGRTYLVDYVPLFVEGKGSGRVWHHNDVTELKKAQEERESLKDQLLQAQKMEAIGTLTGGIAHDFNNLLTIINGFTEMILMEKTEGDPDYADLQKILQTGRKGADMVQRLLSFTKQAAPNLEPMDLNRRIEEGKKLMEATFPKMIEIETILADDLSTINADAGQIDQVLMNLSVNAKDAMPDGGRLRIETRNMTVDEDYCRLNIQAKPGRYVLIEISDTGAGMDTETMARMFDPFYTTKGWDSRKGTGLGLPVVKGIVEQHGGWITCKSELGKGTTIAVWFPVIADSPQVREPETPAEPVPIGDTILLVDDEEYVRDLGKRILERFAYTVITAANGKEALSIYAREQPKIALVVLDLIMPEMEGKQCLDKLLKIDPQVKVIISSGHSLDAEERKRLGAFIKSFVNKPYDVEQLVQAVKEALKSGGSTG